MSAIATLSHCLLYHTCIISLSLFLTQSAAAVEYTGCISARGKIPLDECPEYDIKLFDGEVTVMLELWGMQTTPSLP